MAGGGHGVGEFAEDQGPVRTGGHASRQACLKFIESLERSAQLGYGKLLRLNTCHTELVEEEVVVDRTVGLGVLGHGVGHASNLQAEGPQHP